MTIDMLVNAGLQNVRRAGRDKWTACCPAHDSKSGSSLSITMGRDGGLILYDHGHCTIQQILGALGLSLRDLGRKPRESTVRPPGGLAYYEHLFGRGQGRPHA